MQNIKIAVDAVVFGYQSSKLYVLLIQQKFGSNEPYWALPGGLVHDDETLTDAVKRELQEETGITINHLEQLYTFGDNLQRDPRGRVISVAYFALTNASIHKVIAGTDADAVRWFDSNSLPDLAFDHAEIIKTATCRLKAKLTYQPAGFNLLPEEFLFSDLENLYCTLLNKDIDRRNFRKKILSFNILEDTGKLSEKKGGRPAKLFRFNRQKYHELEKTGYHFEIKLS